MQRIRPDVLALLVALSVLLLLAGVALHGHVSPAFKVLFFLAWAALGGVAAWAHRRRDRWSPGLEEEMRGQTAAFDGLDPRRAGVLIGVVVALGLFTELMLIRWHSSTLQVFGYFKNLSLLACFLGLGVGYALPARQPLLAALAVPAISFQFAFLHLLRFTAIPRLLNNPVEERLTQGLATVGALADRLLVYGFLLLVFLMTALALLPLGQLAGRCMARLEKLDAYGWNLLGSIGGTLAVAICAFLLLPPEMWLLLCTAPLLILLPQRRTLLSGLVSVGLGLLVLTWPFAPLERDVHSPYQRITYGTTLDRRAILETNGFFLQQVLDLREEAVGDDPELRLEASTYEFPYLLVPDAERVLVLGSGTGNDVAAALRMGAHHVDAVEIDPVILSFGRVLHPESPYSHPAVAVHNEDARNFIRESSDVYDLIVYGWLDSHTTASAMSSVRLDSYVFTVEALREARARLSDRGLVVLSFAAMSGEQAKKIYETLASAFDGESPRAFLLTENGRPVFLAGPGLAEAPLPPILAGREWTEPLTVAKIAVDASTDDWPFLYMPRRRYPVSYAVMNLLLLGVGVAFVGATVGGGRRWFDAPFFLLGAGFMLVETKAITELSLVFGSTWMVATVAIFSVLVMAWFANDLVMRGRAPRTVVSVALLVASLLLGALFSRKLVYVLDPGLAKLALPALLTLPIFCAGLVFSGLLASRGDIRSALASNLLGALFGGLLEYNALFFGYQSLYFVALGMYAAAGAFALRGGRTAETSA